MSDNRLLPAAVVGGLLAVGFIGAGALIGQGVIHARAGDRTVTVRGLSERNVKADLAVLPLRFTASGDVLSEVQTKIDGDLALVRRFLTVQGYPAQAIELGRLEVADTRSREYAAQNGGPRFILAQTMIVRTNDVARVQATRLLNDLVRQDVVLQDFQGPSYIFTKLNDVRPQMIAEGTAAARTGAEQFAKDSGTPLGPIRQATQRSFEILPRDGAAGDEAASIDKKIRVVTTITYSLK
ncbi:SIMPL domain-containing protein [Brevundimonas sp. SPF441]|uniref:SIMPL domain-containing protein n=1 Tax=Brevundimonas sp. SPF441 TaxID=2663795 RepID=UPI00129EF932|nr:SIMPL domain-containing protein [Brevundimonas sp. SPF441]MRL67485.1 DUF541 domain-containing protein [Brevundimonas sp. SPF441]